MGALLSRTVIFVAGRLAIVALTFLALVPAPSSADDQGEGDISPVYRIEESDGSVSYRTFLKKDQGKTGTAVAFRAVLSRQWPAGLVPIYQFKRRGQVTFDRFPPTGQEGITRPIFFALPAEGETTERKLLGRWECTATHWDGATEFFSWDLTARDGRVSGRFDVDTDFRFASIISGSFQDGRIELRVKYIDANYRLWGELKGRQLEGEWVRVEEPQDKGTWLAESSSPFSQSHANTCHLWVIRQEGQPARLVLDGESVSEGWSRDSEPLCRVWR